LVFRGIEVGDMLTTVGAWYGYRFRLTDSTLAHLRVNADLQFSSSAVTLKALQYMLDVSMTFDGNVVTLHSKRTVRTMPEGKRDGGSSVFNLREVGR
jgi:ferric-dicitrate binding protein FerR (iron transport regulator)